ncbi:hypothetical protein [Acinetobacter haemolyticus]
MADDRGIYSIVFHTNLNVEVGCNYCLYKSMNQLETIAPPLGGFFTPKGK